MSVDRGVHRVLAGIVDRLAAAHEHCAYVAGPPPPVAGWVPVEDLVRDGIVLDARIDSLLAGEARGHRDVVGSYLASWLVGPLAEMTVWAWRTERRVISLDPARLWVRIHDGGWVDGVAVGDVEVGVLADDPAAGDGAVRVVAGEDELRAEVARQLAAVARPLFAAVRARLPFGQAGMWGSLADGLAGAALHAEQDGPDGDPEGTWTEISRLTDELAGIVPELRVRPRVQAIPWRDGTWHQPVRGTCCLYYKTCVDPDPLGEGYCSSCPLRPDGSRAEHVSRWLLHHRG